MRIKNMLLLSGVVLFTALPSYSITAEFMEGQFEPVLDIGNVTSIEAWEQPRTQYTPANLRSEYQIRYSGTDKNGRGAYSYTTHFTDYDTKLKGSYLTQDGKYYYVRDTEGNAFYTGEHVDLEPINNSVDTLNNQVNNMNNQVNNIQNQVDRNTQAIDRLQNRMESGFATVTALTGLHPNPRSKEKLEISTSMGIYRDNVAGAIGIFYHPCDRVQLSIGAAYGGHESWAGNIGVTFSIGGHKKHERIKALEYIRFGVPNKL